MIFIHIQVPRDATPAEIKKAYRRLQKACHPDIAGEAGSDVCTILNEAYDVLMNDNARAHDRVKELNDARVYETRRDGRRRRRRTRRIYR